MKTDYDVSTPARFEDAARDFVAKHPDGYPDIYLHKMLTMMEAALISMGFEKGVDSLQAGYTENLIRDKEKHIKAGS